MIKQLAMGLLAGTCAILLAQALHRDGAKPTPPVTRTIHIPSQPTPPNPVNAQSEPTLTDEHLNKVIPAVEVDQIPLQDFIRDLAKNTGANISVNWEELRTARVQPTTEISLHLTGQTGQRVLQLALNNAANGETPVTCQNIDGIVIVSTIELLGRNTVLRSYDVRALIDNPNIKRLSLIRSKATINQPFAFGVKIDAPFSVKQLADAIQIALGREQDLGSNRPPPPNTSINYLNGWLLITDTIENHQKIAEFLAKLR